MDFSEWEPYYLKILDEFGYSREKDERSAELLDSVIDPANMTKIDDLRKLDWSHVSVLGNAPSLKDDIKKISPGTMVVTAGPATSILMEYGMIPDIFVTDLDGPIEADIEASIEGSIAVIHAHGDNIRSISAYASRFLRILPTTQSEPSGRLHNFGGFTDGDRAVIMARHFGARVVDLIGFDFENPTSKAGSDPIIKMRKLQWAKKLIFETNPENVMIRFV